MSLLGLANQTLATPALIEMARRSEDGAYKLMRDAGTFPRDLLGESSIHCLWLAKATAYGLATTILLFRIGLIATHPFAWLATVRARDSFLSRMCLAVSLTFVTIMFASITIYFWNAVWLLSVLCIGIQISLKEQCLLARYNPAKPGAGMGPTGFLTDKQICWSQAAR
jgi:hypothetical protein